MDAKDDAALGSYILKTRETNLRGQGIAPRRLAETTPDYMPEVPKMVAALQKDPDTLLFMQRADKIRFEFNKMSKQMGEPEHPFDSISPQLKFFVGVEPARIENTTAQQFLGQHRFVFAFGNTDQLTDEQMRDGIDLVGFRTYQTMRDKRYGAPHKPDFEKYWEGSGIEAKLIAEDAVARNVTCLLPSPGDDQKRHQVDIRNVKMGDNVAFKLRDQEVLAMHQATEATLADPQAVSTYFHCRSGKGRSGSIIACIEYIVTVYPDKASKLFPGFPVTGTSLEKLAWVRKNIRPIITPPEQLVAYQDIGVQLIQVQIKRMEATLAASPVALSAPVYLVVPASPASVEVQSALASPNVAAPAVPVPLVQSSGELEHKLAAPLHKQPATLEAVVVKDVPQTPVLVAAAVSAPNQENGSGAAQVSQQYVAAQTFLRPPVERQGADDTNASASTPLLKGGSSAAATSAAATTNSGCNCRCVVQ